MQSAKYAAKYLRNYTNVSVHEKNTRNKMNIHMLHRDRKDPNHNASVIYNRLPKHIKNETVINKFKHKRKS